MPSKENGLSDIPDFDGMDDEAFPPLPPPHSPGQEGEVDGNPFGNDEEDGEVSKLADVPTAKRKGVKRPQPKLDSQRLISDRGLPALRTLFEDVRFRGKGHEAEDLRLLMQRMENWAHRLYPKLQFEDFIDRLEKLGNKKEVQTCLKRIRLDMPLIHEDFIGDEEPAPETHVFGDPDPFSHASFPVDLEEHLHSTPAPSAPPAPSPSALSPFASPAAPSLTEEQRRRMELNRQRALERKLARQQQQHTDPTDSQTVDSSSSAEEPTSAPSAEIPNSSKAQEKQEEEEKMEKDEEEEGDEPTSAPSEEACTSSKAQDKEEEAEQMEEESEEPTSFSSAEVLNCSKAEKDKEEKDKMEDLNLKPCRSSTQTLSDPPQKESKAPAKSDQREKEKETSENLKNHPEKEHEDGDE